MSHLLNREESAKLIGCGYSNYSKYSKKPGFPIGCIEIVKGVKTTHWRRQDLIDYMIRTGRRREKTFNELAVQFITLNHSKKA